jgi:hypothetical protein
MAWQYGVAQTVAVTFYSAGEPTAPTGALSATISKDGGAFASISGTVTQIGATACALLSLAIADTTCDAGVVKITDAGGTADDRYVEFTTEADYTATRAGYIDAAITSREASGAAAAAVVGLAATGEAAAAVATLNDFDPTSDTVAHVTLVDTTTTNTDMLTAAAVWAYATRALTDKANFTLTAAYDPATTAAQASALTTLQTYVLRVLGLVQENQYIDTVVLDTRNRMTSARLRTYSVAASVGTTSDVLATYTITATYTGTEEAPTTYKVVKA